MKPALLSKGLKLMALLGGAGLIVAIWGVIDFGRGADPALMPQMVRYEMPDGREIYVQSHEVTLDEWNRCNDAGACGLRLRLPVGAEAVDYPATGLSFVDVQQYLGWISLRYGQSYRLPSVAEWRAMAAPVLPPKPDPIFTDPALTWASAYLVERLGSRRLEPSGSYAVTAQGIGDLNGNVWEWTQDCFAGAGEGLSVVRCPAFYVMGEHEAVMSYLIRDPARGGCAVGAPPAHLGMRLVLDAKPKA
jgi:hypothetical protein